MFESTAAHAKEVARDHLTAGRDLCIGLIQTLAGSQPGHRIPAPGGSRRTRKDTRLVELEDRPHGFFKLGSVIAASPAMLETRLVW